MLPKMYTDLEVLLCFGKKQLWLYRRYTCMYSICRYTMIHIKQLDDSTSHSMRAGFDFAYEFTFGGCGTFYLSVFFWQQDSLCREGNR